jgi:hypothetical protein
MRYVDIRQYFTQQNDAKEGAIFDQKEFKRNLAGTGS